MTEKPDRGSGEERIELAGGASAGEAPPRRRGAGVDLSREIERVVERDPGDEVRCTRVGPETYRCNWWCTVGTGGYDNPGMKGGQLATDHRVRRSSYLRASRGRDGLRITDASLQ